MRAMELRELPSKELPEFFRKAFESFLTPSASGATPARVALFS
jgi:hypothetical protein